MTVTATNDFSGPYTGNGSTTAFPFTFKAQTTSEAYLEVDGVQVSATIALTEGGGGTATASSAPASGTTVYVRASPSFQQNIALTNNGVFSPLVIEEGFDRAAERDIYLKGEVDRSLKVPVGETPPTYAALSATFKGDPGGNAMAVGAFAALSTLNITLGTDLIRTSENRSGSKIGGAFYIADAAVDAAFVTANPKWSVITANGRGFRLDSQQTLWLEMFGAYGDAADGGLGTDDYPCFLAAMKFQEKYRYSTSGNTDYKPAPTIWLRNRAYRTSQALNFDRAGYVFKAMGHNHNGLGGASIYVDSGHGGAVFQSFNTSGLDLVETTVSHTPGTDPRGAAGSCLEDISFWSRGGTVGATDQNGVLSHANITLRRVYAFDFGGNGIAWRADIAQGSNANLFVCEDCGAARSGLNNYYDQGGDVNAAKISGFNAIAARQLGICAENYLGNWYRECHTDGNGILGAGPTWATNNVSTLCAYGGRFYRVRPGAHVAASTTTPGTNANVWVDIGTVNPGGAVNWTSGLTWVTGGPFYAGGPGFTSNNNSVNVFSVYAESNQARAWSDSTSSVCLPGFSQWVGANLFVQHNAVLSGKIGAFSLGATAGRYIYATLGGLSQDNSFFQLGNTIDEVQNWSGKISDAQQISFSYSGQNVLILNATGIGASFPRSITGTWPTYADNAAAIAGGLAVGDVYVTAAGDLRARV